MSCFRVVASLTVFMSFAGCGFPDFPKYRDLGDLRVLGLIAEPPEARPGQTVILTPVLSDIAGKGRKLSFTVETCLDPGLADGVEPNCGYGKLKETPYRDETVVDLKGPNHTGATAELRVKIPIADDVFKGASFPQMYFGVNYLLTYTVRSETGDQVRAFRRLKVSLHPTPNQNPTPQFLFANGVELKDLPKEETRITPSFKPDSYERYSGFDEEGGLVYESEELESTWFISDGSLQLSRTSNIESNTYTPPQEPPSERDVVIVLMTRDGRGGLGMASATLKP